jgi:hypothetical protein
MFRVTKQAGEAQTIHDGFRFDTHGNICWWKNSTYDENWQRIPDYWEACEKVMVISQLPGGILLLQCVALPNPWDDGHLGGRTGYYIMTQDEYAERQAAPVESRVWTVEDVQAVFYPNIVSDP